MVRAGIPLRQCSESIGHSSGCILKAHIQEATLSHALQRHVNHALTHAAVISVMPECDPSRLSCSTHSSSLNASPNRMIRLALARISAAARRAEPSTNLPSLRTRHIRTLMQEVRHHVVLRKRGRRSRTLETFTFYILKTNVEPAIWLS